MSGHTPGKWVARTDPNGSPNDWCIGLDDHVSPVDYIATCSARDARLIAAAPELFAEVEREYTELSHPENWWAGRASPEGQRRLCDLRDLIAKVTGRDPQAVQDDYGNRHLTE